jgi:hypothetical protein
LPVPATEYVRRPCDNPSSTSHAIKREPSIAPESQCADWGNSELNCGDKFGGIGTEGESTPEPTTHSIKTSF